MMWCLLRLRVRPHFTCDVFLDGDNSPIFMNCNVSAYIHIGRYNLLSTYTYIYVYVDKDLEIITMVIICLYALHMHGYMHIKQNCGTIMGKGRNYFLP